MAALVYLIGAGPGDTELITLRGLKCIQQADVVVYDYLANSSLLAYARPDAKLIYVGKKGFSKHVTQDEINACLVSEALGSAGSAEASNRIVARLKGGDPYVFGRGGEEALALRTAGIAYQVVPGVTSGIAAPAYAGIPVTHRKVSSSVAFITGNEDPTKEETSIDWQGIANGAETLCFYMGVKNLPQISAKLIEAGRAADTPVALVRWGTTPQQEVLTGTLSDIAQKAAEAQFKAPAIIIVGNVVSLRDQLAWREDLPLQGMSIAVTRARTQASVLVEGLRKLGADVLECPTIKIRPVRDSAPVEQAVDKLAEGEYDWVVFTSTNGVEQFFDHLHAMGRDTRCFGKTKVAAIGSATGQALADRGITVDLIPPKYVAESVVESMLSQGVGAGVSVLIARARQARDILPESLRDAGAYVDVVAVYETVPADGVATQQVLRSIVAGEIKAVTFTSTSTVRGFVGLLDDYIECNAPSNMTLLQVLSDLNCYSIGPITSKALVEAGAKVAAEASVYTIDGLMDAIATHIAKE